MDTSGQADKVDKLFDDRKRDHLEHALHPGVQATELRDIDSIELIHEALPEIDFREVVTDCDFFGKTTLVPFYISSMTAGHAGSVALNQLLAECAQDMGWAMGVGSQRKQLFDPDAQAEWKTLRRQAPKTILFGNIGMAQLIETSTADIARLAESIEATAFIVHLNPLQECLQREGTPSFRGGFEALSRLCKELPVPIIVKETGCGFAQNTLRRLVETGVSVIDVSGAGGTHWGRVEGARSTEGDLYFEAAKTYGRWGIGTVESLGYALELNASGVQVWASGGVRNGLDAAKLIAFGAEKVGFAQAALAAAVQGGGNGESTLHAWMQRMEFELRVALFCTGSKNLNELKAKKVWKWNSQKWNPRT